MKARGGEEEVCGGRRRAEEKAGVGCRGRRLWRESKFGREEMEKRTSVYGGESSGG